MANVAAVLSGRWRRLLAASLVTGVATVAAAPPSPSAARPALAAPSVERGGPDGGPALDPEPTSTVRGRFRTWTGAGSGVAGSVTYDDGELIITDHPFDDRGGNTDGSDGRTDEPGEYYTLLKGANAQTGSAGDYRYPADPVFVRNAADIVEVRVAADRTGWSMLVVLNALVDPERTALEIRLGPRRLLVHGQSATLDGTTVDVAADAEANTFEVRVPHAVFDPGRDVHDLFVAAGLWDPKANGWLDPNGHSTAPPYFDLGFVPAEPLDSYWLEKRQAADIAAGSFAKDVVAVDFGALRDRRCPHAGCPRPPAEGLFVRTFRSGQPLPEGVAAQERFDQDSSSFGWNVYNSAHQPYAIYVPKQRSGALVLLLHFLGGNHMSYPITSMPALSEWAERLKVIVAMPLGRGEAGWYEGEAEKDVFEVWRDVARHYEIDRERVYLSGMSMGGFGTWRLGHLYPDQFSRAIVWSGPVTPYTIWLAPTPVMTNQQNPPACNRDHPDCGYTLIDLFGNAGSVPYLVIHGGADELVPSTGAEGWMARFAEVSDGTFRYVLYPAGRHETTFPGTTGSWIERWLGGLPARVQNPPRVSYRVIRDLFQPRFGIRYDGAYWVRGLELADGASEGHIDARTGDAAKATPVGPQPGIDGQGPFRLTGRDVVRPEPGTNAVEVSLKGLSRAVLDTARMGWDHSREVRVAGSSDSPVELVLDGPFPAQISVTGAPFTRRSPPVVLSLPAGRFDVTVARSDSGRASGSGQLPATNGRAGGSGPLPATGGSPGRAPLLVGLALVTAAVAIRRVRTAR